jgi:hypothetical protein
MNEVLNADQRRHLDASVQRARAAAERAAADALHALAVAEPSKPSYLSHDDNALRLALREKARQLGDDTTRSGAQLTNLVREVAYEQWHRLLFARFLEVNGLLRHPEFRDTSLTLEDCSDLADDLGEPDGWSVAALFAAEILPGVFRLDDPTVRVQFATEHRLELERILLGISAEVFVTEDALGWVYQFWQTAEKKRVNESGVKISGADLSPVTQLFTEHYMVRFLLENSLGAWWAVHHPESPLIGSWDYLRRLDDGTPAAGTFPEWPRTAAEVTVMDPCCGSGHFLVEAFSMLWQMRAEEEGLAPTEAQDAVLSDNLFGLELDARCVQIAMFNVALKAWKVGGGWRQLPVPNVACSGIPVKATAEEWKALALGDERLEKALVRLHMLFSNADTLGSLIDPRRVTEITDPIGLQASLDDVDWDDVAPLIAVQAARETSGRPTEMLGISAGDVARAAGYLSRQYTLAITNVPYLTGKRQGDTVFQYVSLHYPQGKADLATAFVCRLSALAQGSYFVVTPENWLNLTSYTRLREDITSSSTIQVLARLGPSAFGQISGEVVKPIMIGISPQRPSPVHEFAVLDTLKFSGPDSKSDALKKLPVAYLSQARQRSNPDCRILLRELPELPLMSSVADCRAGILTGDYPRFGRNFWEFPLPDPAWELQQSTVAMTTPYGGREHALLWEHGTGQLESFARENRARLHDAHRRGNEAWGRRGIVVSAMGNLPVTLYTGELFDNNVGVISAHSDDLVAPLWHFCASEEFRTLVRTIDNKMNVTNRTLTQVPFDIDRWRKVAEEAGPLPEPHSDDPTQWLFRGDVPSSTQPLQVAVARLLGYQWPDQQSDNLGNFIDADGIAALQSLPHEPDLATRLREMLATIYAEKWSNSVERTLVVRAGCKSGRLEDWLRDFFFAQHARIFGDRPFLWHIWDGRKDGFSAIVNYHRLDHRTLEKLTFTVLGAWIERQKYEADAGRAGADTRLAAALDLQGRLKLILDGAPPYDVYVRWKEMSEQPIGWDPDLTDGIRLNIRPFVTAGVLRSKVNVHWKKDKGASNDGRERLNDLHPTLEERRTARQRARVGSGEAQ